MEGLEIHVKGGEHEFHKTVKSEKITAMALMDLIDRGREYFELRDEIFSAIMLEKIRIEITINIEK